MSRRVSRSISLVLFLTGLVFASIGNAAVTRIEQTHPSIAYQGSWSTINRADVSGDSLAASNQTGASATVRFRGTAIQWIGYRCPCAGGARIYLDGALVQTVDTYSTLQQPQSPIYRANGLADGVEHVLRIELTGATSTSATGSYIGVDAFLIESTTWTLQQDAPEISYTGSWGTITHAQANGGSLVAARDAGASATVRFTGTGLEWIGAYCACAGSARIYVDGVLRNTVDTYRPTLALSQSIYQINDLADTEHTVRIEVTGTRNANGTEAYVGVDAFRVTLGDNTVLDSVLPVVRLQHQSGETMHGNIQRVLAEAYDNVGIEVVRFYVDDALIGDDTTGNLYAVSWDTTDVSDGSHTLYAIARDGAGNETRSASVTVNVDNAADREAPVVRLTSPAPDSLLTGIVTISADATDNVGVTKVQFFASGTLLGEDTTAPYSITRDTSAVPSGKTFSIYAQAFDSAGNLGPSTPYTPVTIQHEDNTRPTVNITQPTDGALISGTATFVVDANDDQGIARVDVFRPQDWGHVGVGSDTAAPYSVAFDTTGLPDGKHNFFAVAVDTTGNASTRDDVDVIVDNSVVPGRVRVDDANPAAVYGPNWTVRTCCAGLAHPVLHWGSAHMSVTPGATMTFTFAGIGVRWISLPCFECGRASVSIDGGAATEVFLDGGRELGAPGTAVRVVYTSPVLSNTSHTLTITVLDRPSPAIGKGTTVFVDAFEVLTP